MAEYLILTHLSANVEVARLGSARQAGTKRAVERAHPSGRPLKQARLVTQRQMCVSRIGECDECELLISIFPYVYNKMHERR